MSALSVSTPPITGHDSGSVPMTRSPTWAVSRLKHAHHAEDERQAQERSPAGAGRPRAPGSPDTEHCHERRRQRPGITPDQRRQVGRDCPDDPGRGSSGRAR